MEGTNLTRKKSYYSYDYDQISSEFFFLLSPILVWASLVAQMLKNPPAMWETWVWSLGWDDPLEEGMATHSSILAWAMGSQRDTTEQHSTAQY